MSLVSNHSFESWVSEKEHIIVYLVVQGLLVDVVLTVFGVARLFEGKALHAHLLSVYNNAFVERLRRKNVFHPPYELELVFV